MRYLFIKGLLNVVKLGIWDRHLRARFDFHVMQWERDVTESFQVERTLQERIAELEAQVKLWEDRYNESHRYASDMEQ
jgi:uridine kinase